MVSEMTASAWLLIVTALLIVPALLLSTRALNRIDKRLCTLEARLEGHEHNTLTPVFSSLQVRQARSRFTEAYTHRIQTEKTLYGAPAWLGRSERTEPSAELCSELRRVCEALVEAECAWQEYAFMIHGNLRVANQGEQGSKVVSEWEALLDLTRGIAVRDSACPNRSKLQRVETLLNNWIARLGLQGTDVEPVRDEFFRDVWEDRETLTAI
jgi:hypothetical protein